MVRAKTSPKWERVAEENNNNNNKKEARELTESTV